MNMGLMFTIEILMPNMLYIVRELIKNGVRPKIFCSDVNIQ